MAWKPGAVVVLGPRRIRVNGFQALEGARVSHLGQKAKVTSQGENRGHKYPDFILLLLLLLLPGLLGLPL